MSWSCPKCGHMFEIPLPVEPLYSLDSAALLIPNSRSGLYSLLSRYKDRLSPAIYRASGQERRRLLTASDIKTLRSILYSNVRYRKRGQSPLSDIYRRPNMP